MLGKISFDILFPVNKLLIYMLTLKSYFYTNIISSSWYIELKKHTDPLTGQNGSS